MAVVTAAGPQLQAIRAMRRELLTVEFVIPARTSNPLNGPTGNSRLAATIRSRKRAQHRAVALVITRGELARYRLSPVDLVPCVVTLTRVSAGKMDGDGLQGSQKGIRDGIAQALGVDDGSEVIEWRYAQARGKRGKHAVHVRIERKQP